MESLVVLGNGELATLAGLERLKHVEHVSVVGNPKLANLDGLQGLREAQGVLLAANGLRTTRGLENLTRIGQLTIRDNPHLHSLRGLRGLTHAGGIAVVENRSLAVHQGIFEGLRHVEGKLHLSGSLGIASKESELKRRMGSAREQPMLLRYTAWEKWPELQAQQRALDH